MPIRVIKSLSSESIDNNVDSKQFIKTDGATLEFVTTTPGSISKWHHHGDYEIFNYIISGEQQFLLGPNGEQVITS